MSGVGRKERRKRVTTYATLSAVVLGFVIVYLLLLRSSAPGGIVDLAPPSGNFTGTTTITTTFGYACVASHIPGAENLAGNSTTAVSGIGMQCSPDLFGALQIPFGSEIAVAWIVTLVVVVALIFYVFRWSPTSINKPFST